MWAWPYLPRWYRRALTGMPYVIYSLDTWWTQ